MKKILTLLLTVLMVATMGIVNVSADEPITSTYEPGTSLTYSNEDKNIFTITKGSDVDSISYSVTTTADTNDITGVSSPLTSDSVTIKAKQAGTYTLTYTSSKDGVTVASGTVEAVIAKANRTWSYTSNPKAIYNTTNNLLEVSGTIDGEANPEFSVDGGPYGVMPDATSRNAGKYQVSWRVAETANYNSTSGSVDAIVKKAATDNSTVTGPTVATSLTYNGSDQGLMTNGASTTSPNRTIEYAYPDTTAWYDSYSSITAANAGQHTIYYRIKATDNYEASEAQSVSTKIAKATQTISSFGQTKTATYNDSDQLITITGPSNAQGSVTYTKIGGSLAGATVNSTSGTITVPGGTKAGSYKVVMNARAAATNNYSISNKVSSIVTITIENAFSPMTFANAKSAILTYSTTNQSITLTEADIASGNKGELTYSKVNDGTTLTNATVDSTNGTITVPASTPVGQYYVVVKATDAGLTNKYNSKDLYKTVTITINKAPSMYGTITNPTENTLTFSGNELVLANESAKLEDSKNSLFKYAVTANTVTAQPTTGLKALVTDVTVKYAGTYRLWSILQGDENHLDKNSYVDIVVNKMPADQTTYKIDTTATSKTYTKNINSEATVKSNMDLVDLEKVLVDDVEVAAANYEKTSGSTIITFKKAYLDSLTDGNHTVELVYNSLTAPLSTTLTVDTYTYTSHKSSSSSKSSSTTATKLVVNTAAY